MYSYFAFPKLLAPLRKAITTLQIAQFVVVVFCILSALALDYCDSPPVAYGISLALYCVYLFDFVKFFQSAYRKIL